MKTPTKESIQNNFTLLKATMHQGENRFHANDIAGAISSLDHVEHLNALLLNDLEHVLHTKPRKGLSGMARKHKKKHARKTTKSKSVKSKPYKKTRNSLWT